jgi:hypothetical protein
MLMHCGLVDLFALLSRAFLSIDGISFAKIGTKAFVDLIQQTTKGWENSKTIRSRQQKKTE